jgi:GTP-binding protein
MEIRNIAIIAHVDHGKTTLTDTIMAQCGHGDEGSMDSNALEQERGITIYAKNTSVIYKGTKINIVDTPGHADFGSEVERVLRSIDAVLLVVDAQEGPMPQTRFVLKKSLELGLQPIVVINKIDKKAANPMRVHDEILELFIELGAHDSQIDFPTVYAVGKEGTAKLKLTDESKDLTPLLDTILKYVKPANDYAAPEDGTNMDSADTPSASPATGENMAGEAASGSRRHPDKDNRDITFGGGSEASASPMFVPSSGAADAILKAQVFNLGYDNFLGRLAVCRIYSGTIENGQEVFVKQIDGESFKGKITKLFTFEGKKRVEVDEAQNGDIIMVAGLPDIYIGETITNSETIEALPAIKIDEPTISLNFLVNNSPFAGREGKFVTGRQIRERLEKELEVNVGLRVDFSANEYFKVYGRGELHIAILLEYMRREGYELQVSQPQVIEKIIDGVRSEPFEEVTVDIKEEYSGIVIEKLGKRKAIMTHMKTKDGLARMLFEIPTRGLLGYRNTFIIDTKGEGIIASRFISFKPYAGEIEKRETGSMTSMISGKSLGFSLWNLQDRGRLYISPAMDIYEGMVIGDTAKGDDMDVNPCKGKQLTNMRASGSDEHIMLTPPYKLSIERGLELMREDEYLEITPLNIRLRKKYLTAIDRARATRKDF